MITLFTLTLALQAPQITAATPLATDADAAALHARATQAHAPGGQAALGAPGPGSLLFSMVGVDNAECVRAIPDVTGDGRDEIVVGLDESGVPNVLCLNGASSGTASVVWSVTTNGGLSGGSPYGDFAIEAVSDHDGDGRANVLVATAWGGRTGYDLDTLAGTESWRFDTYMEAASGWVYSMCEIGDVNGDGVPEVALATGSNNDAVYLLDGASAGGQATVLWRYAGGDAAYCVKNIGDVNGDGKDDVLAAFGDSADKVVCLSGGSTNINGTALWSYAPPVSVRACGVQQDLTGDGINEALVIVWTTDGTAVRCLNGTNGFPVWPSSGVSEFGMATDPIEDVTGDGVDDIVVSSWENAAIVLNGATGAVAWKTTVGTTNGGDVWTSCAIDDVTGDGFQDVVAGSFDTNVYVLNGVTGAIVWAYPTGNRIFSVCATGDLNGDGTPDVAAGTQDTTSNTVVYVLEGDGGGPVPFPTFCDGSDGALASCPCGNAGSANTGCDVAQGTGGVALSVLAQETTPLNRATLQGSGFPPAAAPTAVVLRAAGLEPVPLVFGDGLRCVGTPLVRLEAEVALGGVSTHMIGHSAMAGPGTFAYQLWFRNTPSTFCDPFAAFNLSSGRQITW
jgi:outer membrane protein assembly factor BamB